MLILRSYIALEDIENVNHSFSKCIAMFNICFRSSKVVIAGKTSFLRSELAYPYVAYKIQLIRKQEHVLCAM
ncbi:MAG TPA: hypothetical protein DIT05_12850 [Morganella sp. (in: Bacteria)]|nr:hypothetical protein [Morganella sp. (in: enterobacteria)]